MDSESDYNALHGESNNPSDPHLFSRNFSNSARIITLRQSETDTEDDTRGAEDSGIVDEEGGYESNEAIQGTPHSSTSEPITLPSSDSRDEEDRAERVPLDVVWGRRGDPPNQVNLKWIIETSFIEKNKKGCIS